MVRWVVVIVQNSADGDFRVKDETRDTYSSKGLEAAGGARVVSMVGKKEDLNIPKENEKTKDDIVLPRLKVPDYGWRGCAGT
jgi:hypothetical protein